MDRVAEWVVARWRLAWMLVLAVALAIGWGADRLARHQLEQARLVRLQAEVQRLELVLMSQTLHGSAMGGLGLLGLLDQEVKQEALGALSAISPVVSDRLGILARAYGLDGAFIVGQDAVIRSFTGSGPSATGVDVAYRPYVQMAFQGKVNVYAAVGTTTGVRTLYFAAPMHAGVSTDSRVIGAVVGRAGVAALDQVLRDKADVALLLSPQDLVFASSQPDWIGYLAAEATPGRLAAIRQLRQFGKMFDQRDPERLPLSVAPGLQPQGAQRHAVASIAVPWNDPSGDWKLVLLEDLGRTVPWAQHAWIGATAGCLALMLSALVLQALRARQLELLAQRELAVQAQAQQRAVEGKSQLAAAGLRLQQARDPTQLVQLFLTEAHALAGALQGVVYLAQGATATLRLAGAYACAQMPAPEIEPGEGLLGQVALERRSQLIAVAPPVFSVIGSGLGDARPGAVWIAPLMFSDVFLGVVEIALLQVPDEAARERFDALMTLLAVNLGMMGRSHPEPVVEPSPKEFAA